MPLQNSTNLEFAHTKRKRQIDIWQTCPIEKYFGSYLKSWLNFRVNLQESKTKVFQATCHAWGQVDEWPEIDAWAQHIVPFLKWNQLSLNISLIFFTAVFVKVLSHLQSFTECLIANKLLSYEKINIPTELSLAEFALLT